MISIGPGLPDLLVGAALAAWALRVLIEIMLGIRIGWRTTCVAGASALLFPGFMLAANAAAVAACVVLWLVRTISRWDDSGVH